MGDVLGAFSNPLANMNQLLLPFRCTADTDKKTEQLQHQVTEQFKQGNTLQNPGLQVFRAIALVGLVNRLGQTDIAEFKDRCRQGEAKFAVIPDQAQAGRSGFLARERPARASFNSVCKPRQITFSWS